MIITTNHRDSLDSTSTALMMMVVVMAVIIMVIKKMAGTRCMNFSS